MEQKQIYTIIYFDTVNATATKTLSSKKIPFKFRINEIIVDFPINTERTNKLTIIASDNDSTPSSRPSGENVLATKNLSPQDPFLVGCNQTVRIKHTSEFNAGSYLKIFAENSDTFQHTIDASIQIERLN